MHFFVEKITNANIFKLFKKEIKDLSICIPSTNQKNRMNLTTGTGMDSKFFGVLEEKKIHIQ